jgi:hypothetical protein
LWFCDGLWSLVCCVLFLIVYCFGLLLFVVSSCVCGCCIVLLCSVFRYVFVVCVWLWFVLLLSGVELLCLLRLMPWPSTREPAGRPAHTSGCTCHSHQAQHIRLQTTWRQATFARCDEGGQLDLQWSIMCNKHMQRHVAHIVCSGSPLSMNIMCFEADYQPIFCRWQLK